MILNCIICGREFERHNVNGKGGRGMRSKPKRPAHCLTCCSRCSREYHDPSIRKSKKQSRLAEHIINLEKIREERRLKHGNKNN